MEQSEMTATAIDRTAPATASRPTYEIQDFDTEAGPRWDAWSIRILAYDTDGHRARVAADAQEHLGPLLSKVLDDLRNGTTYASMQKVQKLFGSLQTRMGKEADQLAKAREEVQSAIATGDENQVERLSRELTAKEGEKARVQSLLAAAQANLEHARAAVKQELNKLVSAAVAEFVGRMNSETAAARQELTDAMAPILIRVASAKEALEQSSDSARVFRRLAAALNLT
jgi:hypothetical protein